MTYRRNSEFFEPSRTIRGQQPSEQVMDMKEKLRNEYRKTWEEFSSKMRNVHELAGVGEAAAVEAAMREADLAMAAHQHARNQLAALLAPEFAIPRDTTRAWQCSGKEPCCSVGVQ
ncbi:MAG: hypothetical protein JWN34_3897 [Bryobacterales bacterium]|jgi:hypothetical protein|nr:hypothetical protein [Bryobacterales bacterium]